MSSATTTRHLRECRRTRGAESAGARPATPFANGALRAAKVARRSKLPGLYDMQDVLGLRQEGETMRVGIASSNLGRIAHLRSAAAAVRALGILILTSRIYETALVDCPGLTRLLAAMEIGYPAICAT